MIENEASHAAVAERWMRPLLAAILYLVGIASVAWWLLRGWESASNIIATLNSAPEVFRADPDSPFGISYETLYSSADDSETSARREVIYEVMRSAFEVESLVLLSLALLALLLARRVNGGISVHAVAVPMFLAVLMFCVPVLSVAFFLLPGLPSMKDVDYATSFEQWAEERYGLDIEARSDSDLQPGTEFGLADGRVAVVQESLAGDGTTTSEGLILVERSPDAEFPVQGDGQ